MQDVMYIFLPTSLCFDTNTAELSYMYLDISGGLNTDRTIMLYYIKSLTVQLFSLSSRSSVLSIVFWK